MPNFHPILFKFCAYVNYMLIYKMHREGKFPKTITNLAALFLELFEPPSYLCSETKGADQLRRYCEADLRLWFVGFLMRRLIYKIIEFKLGLVMA